MASLAELLAGDPEAQGAANTSAAMAPAVNAHFSALAQQMADWAQQQQAMNQRLQGQPLGQQALDPKGLQSAMSMALSTGPGAIKAYHGSPYDFDAFDASKIGTGEGAQAYGHGMYFAESPAVAEQYRKAMAGTRQAMQWEGQPISSSRDWYGLEDKYNTDQDWRLANIIKAAGGYGIRNAIDTYYPNTLNKSDGPLWQAAIDKFKEGAGPAAQGRMYEVNINADPERFLNWDKPLSEQPTVQQKLAGAGVINPRSEFPEVLARANTATGGQVYESSKLVPGAYRDPRGASDALNQMGIPGIRYLDQGSRASGNGTNNYVVFDPKIIDIVKKYGLAGLLATGAATMGGGDQK